MAEQDKISRAERLLIAGGPGRGKSTLASNLAYRLKLTHLCTDPQRLLPLTMNGTPDDLDWGGENGVGRWVSEKWLGRNRTVIEGCHLADALKHWVRDRESGYGPAEARSSQICDRLIWLRDKPGHFRDEMPGQLRQAEHVRRVFESLRTHLDNLEIWYPDGRGGFRRDDNGTRDFSSDNA